MTKPTALAFGLTVAAIVAGFTACALTSGPVRGEEQPQEQAKEAPPAKAEPKRASEEYSAGWCAGWAAAHATLMQRHANWRSMLVVGRTEESEKTQVGQATAIVINSVPMYVLLGPMVGDILLPDGTTVTCK